MRRFAEVIVDEDGMAYCSLCGDRMTAAAGWLTQEGATGPSEWVTLWWTCQANQEHMSNVLPFKRSALREILQPGE